MSRDGFARRRERPVAEAMRGARVVGRWARGFIGLHGAVPGAGEPEEIGKIRQEFRT